jgi:ArsR family transcriptional regulator
MGVTKTAGFSEQHNKTALVLKAMGHPARLAIVEHLLAIKSCICGDLVDKLPLSQATISQHLKELKAAEIIRGTIEGNSICYCLNPKIFDFLEAYFAGMVREQELTNSECC